MTIWKENTPQPNNLTALLRGEIRDLKKLISNTIPLQ